MYMYITKLQQNCRHILLFVVSQEFEKVFVQQLLAFLLEENGEIYRSVQLLSLVEHGPHSPSKGHAMLA